MFQVSCFARPAAKNLAASPQSGHIVFSTIHRAATVAEPGCTASPRSGRNSLAQGATPGNRGHNNPSAVGTAALLNQKDSAKIDVASELCIARANQTRMSHQSYHKMLSPLRAHSIQKPAYPACNAGEPIPQQSECRTHGSRPQPKTNRGSYGTPEFFSKARNSSSKLRF